MFNLNYKIKLMLVNYTYYKIYSNDSYNFNTWYKSIKKALEKSKIKYVSLILV